jgi:hypothetical protein
VESTLAPRSADFAYLDESVEAKRSVSLNGVGAGGPEVMGRGPMVISALDKNGNHIFMLDPAGVYIRSSDRQAKLRILGQQRMKRFGFMVVQDYTTMEDELIYRERVHIPLVTRNEILMVKTEPWGLNSVELKTLEDMIEDRQDKYSDYFCFLSDDFKTHAGEIDDQETIKSDDKDCENDCSIMTINEAKLSKVEMERVDHWRNAHRSSDGPRYKERCHTCE